MVSFLEKAAQGPGTQLLEETSLSPCHFLYLSKYGQTYISSPVISEHQLVFQADTPSTLLLSKKRLNSKAALQNHYQKDPGRSLNQ